MWNEVIELGNLVELISFGEVTSSYEFREVYANKKSVKQSEFYQAASSGLRPELVFEVYTFEFNNEEKLRYKDKLYDIIRVYEKGEITEIIVSSMVT